ILHCTLRPPPLPTLFPYTTLFRSGVTEVEVANTNNPNTGNPFPGRSGYAPADAVNYLHMDKGSQKASNPEGIWLIVNEPFVLGRSEEHTSELQSRENLVCRLLLQK